MTQFSCDFDKYEIQYLDQHLKILKNTENTTKYKMYVPDVFFAFDEHIHLDPNQSLKQPLRSNPIIKTPFMF